MSAPMQQHHQNWPNQQPNPYPSFQTAQNQPNFQPPMNNANNNVQARPNLSSAYQFPAYGHVKSPQMPQSVTPNQGQQMPPIMNGAGINNATPAAQPASYMNQSYGMNPYAMTNPYMSVVQNKPAFSAQNFPNKPIFSHLQKQHSTPQQNKKPNSTPKGGRYFGKLNQNAPRAEKAKFIGIPKKPAIKPFQTYNCDVCNVSCESVDAFKKHVAGKQHIKKEKITKQYSAEDKKSPFYCPICISLCSSRSSFKAHVEGKQHIATIKFFNANKKPVPEIKIPDQDPGAIAYLKAKENAPPSLPAKPIGEEFIKKNPHKSNTNEFYSCTLCQCGFSAEVSAKAHVLGRRHKLTYKQKVDPNYVLDVKAHERARMTPLEKKLNGTSGGSAKKAAAKNKQIAAGQQFQPKMVPMMHGNMFPNVPHQTQILKHAPPSQTFFNKGDLEKQIEAFSEYEQQLILSEKEIKSVEYGFLTVKNLLFDARRALTRAEKVLIFHEVIPFGRFTEKSFIILDNTVDFAVVTDEDENEQNIQILAECIEGFIGKAGTRNATMTLAQIDIKNQFLILKPKDSPYECEYKVSILPKSYYTAPESPEDWQKITNQRLISMKNEIKQSQWVEATLCSSSAACQVMRVLRALFDENKDLKPLGEWRLFVLLDIIAQNYHSTLSEIQPGSQITSIGLFRFFFEFLSSGIALPSDLVPKVADPLCENGNEHLFKGMKPDDLINLTSTAQEMLNSIILNQVDKVLTIQD